MSCRTLLLAFLVSSFVASFHVTGATRPLPPPVPNVVIILTDDQGYADVGVYGSTSIQTPNLDRMAREGVRFTDFYVAQPVCSASRAALLTGCYPNRIGIHGALGPDARHGLHSDEMTLAELVKQVGYTTAFYGKWHLGHHPEFLPLNHGFDEFSGIPYSNDMWPFHPEAPPGTYPDLPLIEGNQMSELNPPQHLFTRRFTTRALEFIHRNKDQPFLLFLAHPMPHVPLFASDHFAGKSRAGLYGDVIQEIDWSVGQILTALQRNDLDRRTLVIFLSDNGPWLSYGNHAGSADPLREGKGTVWEGGVRVPAIMRWPGHIPPDTVRREPAMSIDLFPTIAHLVRAPLPTHTIDGTNIWPLISSQPDARSPQDAYFFYYNVNELQAVRSGQWKLILPHTYRTLADQPAGNDGVPAKYQSAKANVSLYDLENDPAESTNVATRHPEILARLLHLAESARQDLGDSLTQRKGPNTREPGRLPDPPTLPPPRQ
jgi:arylsulfatase A